ncbi:aminotransferase class V-fold PLP-dependent enzyme [Virgibacillus sp.]|uniref:aminotransferase class V-fold PLP-dependent enzyme n=1 Tax=Virgibacillus sp. TaxID=1872700 RepID=UPI00184E67F8|nr:aminotransferase class V-fold PLP-dependent enzyme [Virgibacillus sp.]NWO13469.1 aminotransferase class V-fold PLP-dependent enzyme [Virgibacillus sp.]
MVAYDKSKLKYADSVIPTLTVKEAQQLQFKLVDCMSEHFSGDQFLSMGDLGVAPQYKKPEQTKRVERTLATFFGAENASLVRGAGTGAIRTILSTLMSTGDQMFIHDAPIYTTTQDTIQMLGIKTKKVNYNDVEAVKRAVTAEDTCKVFYVQHARQTPTDIYDLKTVIQIVKQARPDIAIVVDDNYCAMKAYGIGVEFGADYSTFSGFKVLGPEGIGIIVGKNEAINLLQERNYSGGGQIQGYEAMELLRMMTFAPVALATQNEQVEDVCKHLNEGIIEGIDHAYMVNAQSKVIIVELRQPIAQEVIKVSNQLGAATHPVGAESKYEIIPMIYRVSGSFIAAEPKLKEYGLRINPMKSGSSTVLRILDKAIKSVQ